MQTTAPRLPLELQTHTRAQAAWADRLHPPMPEPARSRRMAHVGGLAAIGALVAYLVWRIGFTLPGQGSDRSVAVALVVFEALPLGGLIVKAITLWNIDTTAPPSYEALPAGTRVVVLIPTFDEPPQVIAPTVAAACALAPAHETWVLDDGERPWVAEMCMVYGARYVARPVHDHAKAGNMNFALDLLAKEDADGTGGADIIAVLDCDHVPLPHFLTSTLGWFTDERIALVQGPQSFYNAGAFDDDGFTGEQGLFFNVLMPARQAAGAGPFWCGSTALVRTKALNEVGGVATETITEDMHTTLKLIRAGWKTAYHHQTLALGLAPSTAGQYLVQRRRWGMGAMQILVHERLWAAKKWMSWRDFHEYLNGTLWWLEGIATLFAFVVPIAVLVSGAQTCTASPLAFTGAFVAMFAARLWGAKRLLRREIHWPTAFALRILRVPIGMACVWWLVSRKTLQFEVTPKGAADERVRGRTPFVLTALTVVVIAVTAYAAAGVAGIVPWRTDTRSSVAAGGWLVLAGGVLISGSRRIRAAQFASSRRRAYRFSVGVPVQVDRSPGRLVDISVGGAAVEFERGLLPTDGLVEFELPGALPVKAEMVRVLESGGQHESASLQLDGGDWSAYRAMSLWIFHTPPDARTGFGPGVPAIASTVLA